MVVRHKARGGVHKVYAVDLHVHTQASHGEANSAAEVVASAREGGVKVVGIVDHDTVDGIKAVEEEAARSYPELVVVPGVELSTEYHPRGGGKPLKIHLLGYNLNVRDVAFAATLRYLREIQRRMGEKCLSLLGHWSDELNLPLIVPDELSAVVERGQPTIREWVPKLIASDERNIPLLEAVVRGEGAVREDEPLWEQVNAVLKRHVRRTRLNTRQAVRLITVAGGEAVVAHVLDHENDLYTLSEKELMDVFRSLEHVGLTGLEAHYPNPTEEQLRFIEQAARRLGLKVTGGSDFHGMAGEYVGMCGLDVNPLGRRK